MTTSWNQLRATTEIVAGALYYAAFMLVWICCWPLYRLVRSNTVRS